MAMPNIGPFAFLADGVVAAVRLGNSVFSGNQI